MDNTIYLVKKHEFPTIYNTVIYDPTLFVFKLNGRDIQTKAAYLETMTDAFSFPIPAKGFDGYLDWMRDLSWITASGFVLIIENFNSFMKDDVKTKQTVIEGLKEDILPWWDKEVLEYVVEGQKKLFAVILVEG